MTQVGRSSGPHNTVRQCVDPLRSAGGGDSVATEASQTVLYRRQAAKWSVEYAMVPWKMCGVGFHVSRQTRSESCESAVTGPGEVANEAERRKVENTQSWHLGTNSYRSPSSRWVQSILRLRLSYRNSVAGS